MTTGGAEAAVSLVRRAVIADGAQRTRALMRHALDAVGAQEVSVCANAPDLIKRLNAGRQDPAGAGVDLLVCGNLGEHAAESAKLIERIRLGGLLPSSGALVAITRARTTQEVIGLAVHGLDACVLKPFTSASLADRLRQILARKRSLDKIFAAADAGDIDAALRAARSLPDVTADLKICGLRTACERAIESRDVVRATVALDEAKRLGKAPWMQLAGARIATLRGENEVAQSMLDRLARECPDYVASLDALAGLEKARGDYRAALGHLDAATERVGITIDRMRRTGETAALAGDLKRAGQAFGRMLDGAGDGAQISCGVYANFIDVLLREGRFPRAESLARELRAARPESIEAHVIKLAVDCSRATAEGSRTTAGAVLGTMLRTHDRAGLDLSIPTRMLVLEACVELHALRDARTVAQAIALAEDVDDATLKRVSALLAS